MKLRQPPKAILFDKDGTLLDFHASWQPVNEKAIHMAAKGNPALAARIAAAGGLHPVSGQAQPNTPLAAGTTREIAATFIEAGSPFELAELTHAIDRIFQAGALTAVPVLDLKVYFTRLRSRGLRLGIASSDSEAAIHATAERFEFTEQVDFIAGYDSGHGSKPGPGMLTAFARTIRLDAAEIAVVGDNVHDMEMAMRGGAGLRVAVLTGTGTRDELAEAADLVLESIADLERALFANA